MRGSCENNTEFLFYAERIIIARKFIMVVYIQADIKVINGAYDQTQAILLP